VKKLSFVLVLVFIFFGVKSQQIVEEYSRLNGSLRYGDAPNDVIPDGHRGFTLILPEKNHPVIATILILEDDRVDLQDTSRNQTVHIDKEAIPKGIAVLYISTGIPVDIYFSSASLEYVDSVLEDVFRRYKLPNKNIFLLGAMVSGHRALKYIEYCKNRKSIFNPDFTGVIVCESAIDWVRMWYEAQKQMRDHITPTQNFEGHLITYLFKENFKTTPLTHIGDYIEFSPYSYFDIEMTKPRLYVSLAVRAYTFADTRYWFSAQGKGIYDSNYPDMSGFINEQKIAGNNKAELIVFHSNPGDPLKNEMRRQSSTWDLVDKTELINWMVSQSKQQ
jgi:hypothetical protein